MSRAVIRELLECELRGFSTPRGMGVAVENSTFNPKRLPYLECYLLISDSQAAALGRDAPERAVGIFQVNVVTASNAAGREADGIADALKKHFGRRAIKERGVTITVTKVNAVRGATSAKTYMLPVSIEFRADAEFFNY